MKAVFAVLCVVGYALGAKEEAPRKSRQIYSTILHPVHPQVYDYTHPSLVTVPTHYLQPAVQSYGLTSSPITHLNSVYGPQIPFHSQVSQQQSVGYVPTAYYGELSGNQYNPSYTPSHVHLPPRTHIPDTHPVREENNDYELPTSTPVYGFGQSYLRSSHYGSHPHTSILSHYQSATSRNLASVAPYTFPPLNPTRPSSYNSLGYGSRSSYITTNTLTGVTPSPRINNQLTQNIALTTQQGNQSGTRPMNQDTSSPAGQTNSILSQTGEIRNDGSYNFGFQSTNGIQSEESGRMRAVGSEMSPSVEGAYSYTSPDGTPVSARYFADETGFHVQGSHVPSGSTSSLDVRAGSQSSSGTGSQLQPATENESQQRPVASAGRS